MFLAQFRDLILSCFDYVLHQEILTAPHPTS